MFLLFRFLGIVLINVFGLCYVVIFIVLFNLVGYGFILFNFGEILVLIFFCIVFMIWLVLFLFLFLVDEFNIIDILFEDVKNDE